MVIEVIILTLEKQITIKRKKSSPKLILQDRTDIDRIMFGIHFFRCFSRSSINTYSPSIFIMEGGGTRPVT